MNVTYKNKYTTNTITLDLQEYIERRLYENRDGAVETAQANAEGCQGAMAKLLEILFEKKVITLAEIVTIVDGCEEFIE